jgi:uncharacterized protein (TIGR03118 family)
MKGVTAMKRSLSFSAGDVRRGYIHATMATAALACLWLAAPRSHAADADWAYDVDVLVSDGSVPADFTDHNLKNPWGIAFNPFGFDWVANNHTGTSTLYDGKGNANALVVSIPGVNGEEAGEPTGIVFSGGTDFVVTDGVKKGPARFIFAGEDGAITGWSPDVNLNEAIVAINRSGAGASYRGLAIGGNGTAHRLYATNFSSRRVEVFDGNFKRVLVPGAFVDPKMPAGYAPFGIQNVNGDIVVTYARRMHGADDETAGKGLGIVDLYDADGRFISRLVSFGELNAPWGVAVAPMSFGHFGGALLIGNFGDGVINAYDMRTGAFLGKLRRPDGKAVQIEGLWGIAFGNGLLNQPTNTLYFAAGVHDEAGGASGAITPHGGT